MKRSIESLRATADDWSNIEVLVRLDLNDPSLKAYAKNKRKGDKRPEMTVVGDGLGYKALHVYYNDLAAIAKGDWLFMWNDDVLMDTNRWDTIIEQYAGQFKLLAPVAVPHGYQFCIVPVVPRAWFETTGHLSKNAQADSWLELVARELGVFSWIPVTVLHDRADITGNNNDATFAAREYQSEAFFGQEAKAERAADAERLRVNMLVAP